VPRGRSSAQAQAAYVRLRNVYDELARRGIQGERLPRLIFEALVNRGGWKDSDAAEFIGGFVRSLRTVLVYSSEPADVAANLNARTNARFAADDAGDLDLLRPPGRTDAAGGSGEDTRASGVDVRDQRGQRSRGGGPSREGRGEAEGQGGGDQGAASEPALVLAACRTGFIDFGLEGLARVGRARVGSRAGGELR
jgi:hypothetical protein